MMIIVAVVVLVVTMTMMLFDCLLFLFFSISFYTLYALNVSHCIGVVTVVVVVVCLVYTCSPYLQNRTKQHMSLFQIQTSWMPLGRYTKSLTT